MLVNLENVKALVTQSIIKYYSFLLLYIIYIDTNVISHFELLEYGLLMCFRLSTGALQNGHGKTRFSFSEFT